MSRLPKRKPNRLKCYDYSQNGAYFITLCAKDKKCLFGKVVGDAALGVPPTDRAHSTDCGHDVEDAALGAPHTELSKIGKIVERFIFGIGDMLDVYVIMPNHVHMILIVDSENGTSSVTSDGTPRAASPTKAVIPKVINSFKGLTTKKAGFALWQRSYYDHVIRDEEDYLHVAEYIETNPIKWKLDRLYREE
jgi:REP element-mobilizing transposase RayT